MCTFDGIHGVGLDAPLSGFCFVSKFRKVVFYFTSNFSWSHVLNLLKKSGDQECCGWKERQNSGNLQWCYVHSLWNGCLLDAKPTTTESDPTAYTKLCRWGKPFTLSPTDLFIVEHLLTLSLENASSSATGSPTQQDNHQLIAVRSPKCLLSPSPLEAKLSSWARTITFWRWERAHPPSASVASWDWMSLLLKGPSGSWEISLWARIILCSTMGIWESASLRQPRK